MGVRKPVGPQALTRWRWELPPAESEAAALCRAVEAGTMSEAAVRELIRVPPMWAAWLVSEADARERHGLERVLAWRESVLQAFDALVVGKNYATAGQTNPASLVPLPEAERAPQAATAPAASEQTR